MRPPNPHQPTMNRRTPFAVCIAFAALALSGCANSLLGQGAVTLINGDKGLDNFNRIGDANWRADSLLDRHQQRHLPARQRSH